LDQSSKLFVLSYFQNLVVYNNAVAFSLPIPWYLPWIAILILILVFSLQEILKKKNIVNEISKVTGKDKLVEISFGLVIGGALGNLIDRFLHDGRVIDFIDLKFWPVFNFADSAIVCGVLLFFLRSYIKRDIQKNKEE
jgi:signal peptidase II